MTADEPNSYDAVPYESYALTETHPDHLAALARLFGVDPPGPASCRVLELGCATGGNLIPMAVALPGARFVGVDLSRRQVEEGLRTVEALGLGNVDLRAMSILDVGPDLGTFDYIISHGVYSWVPAEVRDKILQVCGECLSPNGVAYVSYNTYPGWHLRGMVREMLLYHTRLAGGPFDRVRAGRDLLEGLGRAVAESDDPYSHCVRDEAAVLLDKPDYYLLHEHFEEENQPVYFHEFNHHAAGHGLRYLAEARLGSMACSKAADLVALLDALFDDPVEREQYCDFIGGRRFRQTLLCRAGVAVTEAPSPGAVMSLRASGTPDSAAAPAAVGPSGAAEFRSLDRKSTLATSDPLVKAMLHTLSEVCPRSLPFDELWAITRDRLDVGSAGQPRDDLASALLNAFRTEFVRLHVHEPDFAPVAGDRPLASPLARLQVESGPRVTNLRHQTIVLNEFDRLVLYHLDGRRDRESLLLALQDAVAAGAFTIRLKDRPPLTDPVEARPVLESLVGPSLARLAGFALLAG